MRPTQRYTALGTPFMVMEPFGMPRIPDNAVDLAVYLYPDRQSAEEGKDAGGTGFVTIKPMEKIPGRGAFCLITNRHVIQSGASVVRLNRLDGRTDIFDLEPHEWTPHPGPHDLAAICGVVNEKVHKYTQLAVDRMVTREMITTHDIGIGDDVFMVGRFIGHDGKQKNRPSVRFGNISVMLGKMYNPALGHDEESFAVEMRSKPGYSGSPVVVYALPMATDRNSPHKGFTLLLGVNWGHILEKRPVLDSAGLPTGQFVPEVAGLSGVVPAWRIIELLETPAIMEQIKAVEKIELANRAKSKTVIEPTVTVDNPDATSHREDFKRLLGAAVKKKADP